MSICILWGEKTSCDTLNGFKWNLKSFFSIVGGWYTLAEGVVNKMFLTGDSPSLQ
jgi:hypothetical protein